MPRPVWSKRSRRESPVVADTRECRRCGEEIPDTSRFCPQCGEKVLPQEGVAVYEYVPLQPFSECPRCGQDHGEQVLRCQRCGIAVEVELMHAVQAGEQAQQRPLFDWKRGLRQGMVGYAIFQGIIIALNGLPDMSVQWPTYLIFAVLWTTVAAIGLESGPTYGVMLGLIGLEYVLQGFLDPITNAWGVLRLHLIALFLATIGLVLVGLVRGRLEFLRLWNRLAVSRLFSLTAALLFGVYLAGTLDGPGFSRGEIRFESAAVVAQQKWDLDSSRMVFQKGDVIGWVAELKRATRGSVVSLEVVRLVDGQERLVSTEERRLSQSGVVRVLENILTHELEPGWYLVRLREGQEVLAEGRFRLQERTY